MSFERFYGSGCQQPLLLWCAAGLALLVVASRRVVSTSVRRYCIALGLLPFVDAWLTADDVAGMGAVAPGVAVALGSLFAVVGDLRVFLVLEAATPEGELAFDRGKVLRSLAWSLAVPVASAVVHGILPDAAWRARATFLFYEAAFLVLMTARSMLARREAAWVRPVVAFVLAYYALWALADAAILGLGLDVGYLVRTVANVLYYGGFLVAVSLSAPADRARAPSRLREGVT